MDKLKLDLDDLRIESFETASLTDRRGTVRAHDATQPADTCGCYQPRETDGCSIGCMTGADCDTDGDTMSDNNPGTVISF